MMRLARRASLVALLLFPVSVLAAFEKCSWGSPWTTATRNTFSTRAECEGATRAAVDDDIAPLLVGWPGCNCRSTNALVLSLTIAATFTTVMFVRRLDRIRRRRWGDGLLARLAFVVVIGMCMLPVVLLLLLILLSLSSHTPLYAACLPDTIDPRGPKGSR